MLPLFQQTAIGDATVPLLAFVLACKGAVYLFETVLELRQGDLYAPDVKGGRRNGLNSPFLNPAGRACCIVISAPDWQCALVVALLELHALAELKEIGDGRAALGSRFLSFLAALWGWSPASPSIASAAGALCAEDHLTTTR